MNQLFSANYKIIKKNNHVIMYKQSMCIILYEYQLNEILIPVEINSK
jgi:hypothetical protein